MDDLVQLPVKRRPTSYRELIDAKVSELEKSERDLLNYDSPKTTTSIAAISSFLLNVSMKRSMLLYEGTITTGVVCVITSVISNFGLFKLTQDSLFSDPDSCTVCAIIKGGLVQGFTSSVVPLAASFAMGAIVGERFGSVIPPDFTWKNRVEFLKFWRQKFVPVKMPFLISFGLQAALGCFYTYRRKIVLDRVHDSVTNEEIAGILGSQLTDVEKFQSYYR